MSKKGNPALIGAFVVGAVALGIVGVTALGSGRLFRKTYPYVMYFDSDVNGLNVGAPVKFKGVEIGAVKEILLNIEGMTQLAQPDDKVLIPVVVELDADKTTERGAENAPSPEVVTYLIDRGLRAQLANESFVTGVLYVKLDLYPDAPLKMRGDQTSLYPEIPTQPTPFEQAQMKVAEFFTKFQEIDIAGLVDNIQETIKSINTLVTSPGLSKAFDHLDVTLTQVDSTLVSLRETSEVTRSQIEPLARELREVAVELRGTLDEGGRTLTATRDLLDPDAPLAVGIGKTLMDVSQAARAVQGLAELLERNPDALLRGKGIPENKP